MSLNAPSTPHWLYLFIILAQSHRHIFEASSSVSRRYYFNYGIARRSTLGAEFSTGSFVNISEMPSLPRRSFFFLRPGFIFRRAPLLPRRWKIANSSKFANGGCYPVYVFTLRSGASSALNSHETSARCLKLSGSAQLVTHPRELDFVNSSLSLFFDQSARLNTQKLNHLFVRTRDLKSRGFLPVSYYSKFLSSILTPLFSNFLNSSTSLLLDFNYISRLSRLDVGLVASIRSRLQHLHSTFANIIFISEFLDILYFTLLSKDLDSLKRYIRRIFSKLSIWDHKKFAVLLVNMFAHQLYPLFDRLGIRGLYFRIKGKLGVGGNSRKRSMFTRLGEISSSDYPSRASFLNSTVGTTTGVLGIQILIVSDPSLSVL
jgi:hypothetical protein